MGAISFIDVDPDLPGDTPAHYPVLAIGVFDGVHLGHRSLLEAGLGEARRLRAPFRVLTFWPHPEAVLGRRNGGAGVAAELGSAACALRGQGFLLSTLEEKAELLRLSGAEAIVALRFTKEAAAVAPEEFVERTLVGGLRPRIVVVGFNFSFGAQGRGKAALLADLGRKAGFTVIVHPAVRLGGEVISSSAVRRALARGDVRRAGLLLGRPYSLAGKVEKGAGRGKTLGFPTANVGFPADLACPSPGVYICRVAPGDEVLLRPPFGAPAVANIGVCPTFAGPNGPATAALSLEAHVLDGRVPTYGDTVRVFFLERLRPESKFAGPEELAAQIALDKSRAQAYFGETGIGDRTRGPKEDSGWVSLRRFAPR